MQNRITVTLTPEEGEAVRVAAFNARVSKNKWVGDLIRASVTTAPENPNSKPKKSKG